MSEEGKAPAKAAAARARLDPERPYPGPASFEERDAAFFFGRARESAELYSRALRQAITVLYSKSGLGKTSLLQAGVFPRLRRAGYVPVMVRFTFPGEKNPSPPRLAAQVRAVVASAIERGDLEGAPPEEGESLWLYFRSTSFWDGEGDPVVPVLVLDQFEEVFTLGGAVKEQTDELVTELSDLVEDRIPTALRRALESKEAGVKLPPRRERPPAKVMISLREDFLADLDRLSARVPSLGTAAARMSLGPLGYDAAMEAVIEPARARSLISREVADDLVRAAAKAQDKPAASLSVESALLALYCHELNEKRLAAAERTITRELVQANRTIILDGFYDRCLLAVHPAKTTLAQRLVEEKLLIAGRRHIYPVASLGEIGDEKLTLSEADVRPLIDMRLLRKEPRLGEDYLEIIHDVLIEAIEKRKKIRKEEEERQRRARKEEEERRERWQRIWRVSAAVIAVVIVIAGAVGYLLIQGAARRREAEKSQTEATIRAFAAAASALEDPARRAMSDERWEDAARTIAAAHRTIRAAQDTYEGTKKKDIEIDGGKPSAPPLLALLTSRLRAAIGNERLLVADRAGLGAFDVSYAGERGAVVMGDGRSVRLFDVATGRTWDAEPPGRQAGSEPAMAPDKLAVAIDWFPEKIHQLVMSGDGSRVFALGSDGAIAVWSAMDGRRLLAFRTNPPAKFKVQRAAEALQVDWSGRRVLILDDNSALLVSIDPSTKEWSSGAALSATRIWPSVPDSKTVPSPGVKDPPGLKDPGFKAWKFHLAQSGRRVVGAGFRRLPSKGERGMGTRIQAWDVAEQGAVSPVAVREEAASFEQVALSYDGSLLGATGTLPGAGGGAGLFLGALNNTDQQSAIVVKDAQSLERGSWLSFAHPRPILLAGERSLSGWDVVKPGEPVKLFTLPLAEPLSAARLAADSHTAFVSTSTQISRYDVERRQMLAGFNTTINKRPADWLRVSDSGVVVWHATNEVRARSFVPGASGDRVLAAAPATWGRAADLTNRSSGVAQDGDRVLINRNNGVSLVRLDQALSGSPGAEAPATELLWQGDNKRAEVDYPESFATAGGRAVVLGHFGWLSFGPLDGEIKRVTGLSGRMPLLSADGLWAAQASGSTIRVLDEKGGLAWSFSTDKLQASLPDGAASTSVTAFVIESSGPGGAHLVAGAENGAVLTVRKGGAGEPADVLTLLKDSPHKKAVSVIALGPNGAIASGATDGTIAMWDGKGQLRFATTAHAKRINGLTFVKGGALLVAASDDGTARVWGTEDGALRCVMREHIGGVRKLARESEASDRAITADGTRVVVWSASDCAASTMHRESYLAIIEHIGFVPSDRDRFLVGTNKDVWLAQAHPKTDPAAQGPSGRLLWAAPAGGAGLLAGDDTGAVFAWKSFDPMERPAPLGVTIPGTPLMARAAGRLVAVTPLGELRILQPPQSTISRSLTMEPSSLVRAITLSANGITLLVVEHGEGKLRSRRFNGIDHTNEDVSLFLGSGQGCGPDKGGDPDPLVIAGTLNKDPVALAIQDIDCLRIWSGDGMLLLEERLGLSQRPSALALSSSAELMITAQEGEVSFREIRRSGEGSYPFSAGVIGRARSPHKEPIRTITFQPKGRFAVTTDGLGDAWLWDAREGHALVRLAGASAALWAAFDADGDNLVLAGENGYLQSFDTSLAVDSKETLDALERWMPELAEKRPSQ